MGRGLGNDQPLSATRDSAAVLAYVRDRVDSAELIAVVESLLVQTEPAALLVEAATDTNSFLGGTPVAPADFVWPSDANGVPLGFLGQIDLRETPLETLAAHAGILYFFYDGFGFQQGGVDGTLDCAKVVYVASPGDLVEIEPPAADTVERSYGPETVRFSYPRQNVTFEQVPTVPSLDSVDFPAELKDRRWDLGETFDEAFDRSGHGHQLLGHVTWPVQNDVPRSTAYFIDDFISRWRRLNDARLHLELEQEWARKRIADGGGYRSPSTRGQLRRMILAATEAQAAVIPFANLDELNDEQVDVALADFDLEGWFASEEALIDAAVVERAQGWKLLLKLESAQPFDMWGDGGDLYFMIRADDLNAGRFEQAILSKQE